MSGPGPKVEADTTELVTERDEDFSLVKEVLAHFEAVDLSYQGIMLVMTAKSALGTIQKRLTAAQKRAEEAEKERDALRIQLAEMSAALDKFSESFKRNETGNIRALNALFESKPTG